MPDDILAGSDTGDDASVVETPAAPVADIEKVKAEYETRIKGFQRTLADKDRKAQELEARLDDIEARSLPEDEQTNRKVKKLESELAQARADAELARLEVEYPDTISLYRQLLEATSAKEQLDLLRKIAKAEQKADVPPQEDVADVDLNLPSRATGESIVMADGRIMDDSLADRILKSVRRQSSVTQR